MNRGVRGLAAALLIAGSASSVAGQSSKYNAPGHLGIDPGEDREQMEQAVSEALWKVGPVRVDPWIGLRELAWVEPAEGDGDLTTSIGAGVRAYVPIGSKTTIAAQILPTYIWWQDREEDRRLGGTYGVGLFYFSERAGAQFSATKSDLDEYVTDEVDRRAAVDSINYRLRVEVPFSPRLGLFLNAGRYDQEVDDTLGGEGELEDLSSYTDSIEGGLTWLAGSRFTVRVGAGTVETTFDESVRDRGNEGDFWIAGIDWRRSKTGASVTVRQGTLRATSGSEFIETDATTYQARVSWTPRARFGVSIYGGQQLSYSVQQGQVSYLEERVGVRLSFPVARTISGSAFYEDGQRTYDFDDSQDDVTSWGGQLSLPVWRRLQLRFAGRTTAIDSPFRSTTYSEYRIGLSFGSSATFGSDNRGF